MKGMVLPKGWRVTVPTHKTMAMLLTPPAPSTSTCHHFWPHKVNWKCVTILISILLGNECLHYHVNYTSSVIITINLQGLYQWHTKKRALCHAPLPPPPRNSTKIVLRELLSLSTTIPSCTDFPSCIDCLPPQPSLNCKNWREHGKQFGVFGTALGYATCQVQRFQQWGEGVGDLSKNLLCEKHSQWGSSLQVGGCNPQTNPPFLRPCRLCIPDAFCNQHKRGNVCDKGSSLLLNTSIIPFQYEWRVKS